MGLGVALCGSICSGYLTKYLGLVGPIEFGNLGSFLWGWCNMDFCVFGLVVVLTFGFIVVGLLWFGLQCIRVWVLGCDFDVVGVYGFDYAMLGF